VPRLARTVHVAAYLLDAYRGTTVPASGGCRRHDRPRRHRQL